MEPYLSSYSQGLEQWSTEDEWCGGQGTRKTDNGKQKSKSPNIYGGLQVPGVILINTCEFTHLIHTTVMCGRHYCLRFSDKQLKHRVKEQAVWSNRAKIGIPVVCLHLSKGSPSFPSLGLQKEGRPARVTHSSILQPLWYIAKHGLNSTLSLLRVNSLELFILK